MEDRRANVSRGQRLFAFSVYNRSHIFFLQTALSRLHMRWLRRVLIKTSSKKSRILFQRRGIYFGIFFSEYRYQLVCRWHIDLFKSEWVTNLHIRTPNSGRFYASRIYDQKTGESREANTPSDKKKQWRTFHLNCVGCLLTTPSKVRVSKSRGYFKISMI